MKAPNFGTSGAITCNKKSHAKLQHTCNSAFWDFFFLYAVSYLLLNIYYPGFSAFRMGQRQCFQLIAATWCAVIIFGDDEMRHARHMVMITPKDCSELWKSFLRFSVSYQTDNIGPLPVSGVLLAGFQSPSPATQSQLLCHVFLHVKRGLD